jgi:predicted DNA-binding transcriptional regulator YafY
MSAARTERLLNLLALLLNARRPMSLREIRDMEEFAAYRTDDPKSGERAFERDKSELVELGVPLRWVPPEQDEENETEGLGGYVIDRDKYYLTELELGPAEVALLSIAGAAAAAVPHFPRHAELVRALAKIGFDVEEAQPRAPALAHAPIQAANPERVGEQLRLLHEAIARRRPVKLAYRGTDGGKTVREVDPWGLYYRQGIWYLVGWCHLRKGERTFHLGRIDKVELAPKGTFEVPADFDLSAHVRRRPWEFPKEPPQEVVIRLADKLVPAIPELFGGRAQVEKRDGGTVVRLVVTHRQALIAAVLPFGAAAEVLAPADLRQQIGAIYEALAARYGAGA